MNEYITVFIIPSDAHMNLKQEEHVQRTYICTYTYLVRSMSGIDAVHSTPYIPGIYLVSGSLQLYEHTSYVRSAIMQQQSNAPPHRQDAIQNARAIFYTKGERKGGHPVCSTALYLPHSYIVHTRTTQTAAVYRTKSYPSCASCVSFG